jgi:hypothetical protein
MATDEALEQEANQSGKRRVSWYLFLCLEVTIAWHPCFAGCRWRPWPEPELSLCGYKVHVMRWLLPQGLVKTAEGAAALRHAAGTSKVPSTNAALTHSANWHSTEAASSTQIPHHKKGVSAHVGRSDTVEERGIRGVTALFRRGGHGRHYVHESSFSLPRQPSFTRVRRDQSSAPGYKARPGYLERA